jgi:hypothetical protein
MLVYGDPQREDRVERLVRRLSARVASARLDADLDELRTVLVMAGQLEQALADDPALAEPARMAHDVTGALAAAFVAACTSAPAAPSCVARFVAAAGDTLTRIECVEKRVRVKAPEGFAFYAVLPEQYLEAARRFVEGRPRGDAIVLGLRSIGTSLAAVVGAVLDVSGWHVTTMTARPDGHPFHRRVALAPHAHWNASTYGLVVDEGPGLSGSSMAAAADAFAAAGIDPARIVLFPSHAGEPGPMASDAVRAWWRRLERFVVQADEVAVGAAPLREALSDAVARLASEPVVSMEPLRASTFSPLTRPKQLARTRSGRGLALRFEGIAAGPAFWGDAAARAAARHAAQAARGLAPEPLGVVYGHLVRPWIEGGRPSASDGRARAYSSSMVEMAELAHHLVRSAGDPLPTEHYERAHRRLAEMLVFNARELLGEASADAARILYEASGAEASASWPAADGGRFAPDAFVRDPSGRLLRPDAGGALDHTLAGSQPLPWDIASALVEWAPSAQGERALLERIHAEGCPIPSETLLAFHCAAYAALRLGVCAMAASHAGGDRVRRAAIDAASRKLRRALIHALARASSRSRSALRRAA